MTESQKWVIIFSVVAVGLLFYLLAPVLTPFMIAAFFAYLGDPLADRLEKHLSRSFSVFIVFLLISMVLLVFLLVVLPIIERQIVSLMGKLPNYIDQIQHVFIPWVLSLLGLAEISLDFDQLRTSATEHWKNAGNIAAKTFSTISKSGLLLATWIANLLLIPVITFYLLRDWDILVSRIHELVPRRYESIISRLAKDSDNVLSAFLRGQLLVMVVLGVLYTAGLSIIGLDFALLIGVIAGLVSFVPYLGVIVGLIVAGVAAVLQFQEAFVLVYIALVFGVGQVVESFILTPLLVGDKIGLHPVAVIFAVLAGGQLFGFFGILLALPVAAVMMVILRYAHERYVSSQLYVKK